MNDYLKIVGREENILYEDSDIVLFIKDYVYNVGQLGIIPKEKFIILEQVPEKILSKCFKIIKLAVKILNSGLGNDSFNVLISNGTSAGQTISHFCIDIIPRQDQDGLNFVWNTKPYAPKEIEHLYSKISNFKQEKKVFSEDPNTNYLIRAIDRKP